MASKFLDLEYVLEKVDFLADIFKAEIKDWRLLAEGYLLLSEKSIDEKDRKYYLELSVKYHDFVNDRERSIGHLEETKKVYPHILKAAENKKIRDFEKGKSPEEMREIDLQIEKRFEERLAPLLDLFELYRQKYEQQEKNKKLSWRGHRSL